MPWRPPRPGSWPRTPRPHGAPALPVRLPRGVDAGARGRGLEASSGPATMGSGPGQPAAGDPRRGPGRGLGRRTVRDKGLLLDPRGEAIRLPSWVFVAGSPGATGTPQIPTLVRWGSRHRLRSPEASKPVRQWPCHRSSPFMALPGPALPGCVPPEPFPILSALAMLRCRRSAGPPECFSRWHRGSDSPTRPARYTRVTPAVTARLVLGG